MFSKTTKKTLNFDTKQDWVPLLLTSRGECKNERNLLPKIRLHHSYLFCPFSRIEGVGEEWILCILFLHNWPEIYTLVMGSKHKIVVFLSQEKLEGNVVKNNALVSEKGGSVPSVAQGKYVSFLFLLPAKPHGIPIIRRRCTFCLERVLINYFTFSRFLHHLHTRTFKVELCTHPLNLCVHCATQNFKLECRHSDILASFPN